LGHKQTFAAQNGTSALHPKADMCGAKRNARFVPKADIANLGSMIAMSVSGTLKPSAYKPWQDEN
jgi:hypothetical protein